MPLGTVNRALTMLRSRAIACAAVVVCVLAAPAHAADECPAPAPAAEASASAADAAADAPTLDAPGRVFLELGLWQSVIDAHAALPAAAAATSDDAAEASDASEASNAADAAAARARVDRLAARAYAELMLGRTERAERTLASARDSVEPHPDDARVLDGYLEMHARHVVETHAWSDIGVRPAGRSEFHADVPGLTDVVTSTHPAWLYAAGAASAARADVEAAAEVGTQLERLARRHEADGRQQAASLIYVLSAELGVAIARAEGRPDAARHAARQAAELARELGTAAGPPLPVKPAQELYAEVLLETGCEAAAAAAFERALSRTPNRTPALLGLARAERARGDAAAARRVYARIAALPGANAESAAVREARDVLGAAEG